MIWQYRAMQVRDIQEQRYQSMFMLITSLKGEIYLMRKNTEEIEQIMGNAYRLHELAEQKQAPEEVRRMTLDIAKDVHEIKKGYIRIMDGLESTINAENEEERMTFRELLEILEGMAKTRVRKLELDVSFLFDCRDNFVTTCPTPSKPLKATAVPVRSSCGSVFRQRWKQGTEKRPALSWRWRTTAPGSRKNS